MADAMCSCVMEIGEKIDNYVVTEVLAGGMSEAYRVVDGTERYVLKIVKQNATPEDIKLFRREIRILKRLNHPNIIKIVSDTCESDRSYYVMPNCGKSFVELACATKTELELFEYVIPFCEAIQYAHTQHPGVFHRDIKPQNVLLYKDVVKVSDFGLSRFVDRDTTTMTQTGTKAGTAGYMPPEFHNGEFKEGTVAGDVYMIGKTLYYVFSHGKDVSNVRPEMVSWQIFSIVDKCTNDNPTQRYASVSTIVDELMEYRDILKAAETSPQTIKEIKAKYKPNTSQYNKEVFKTLNTIGNNPVDWGNTLRYLKNQELEQVLMYNRDSIVPLSLYFIDCLKNASDFVQFDDIDEYARFTKVLVDINTDESIKRNLILFLLNMSIYFNRFQAMKVVASILNEQIDKDYAKYKIFVMLQQGSLVKISETLNDSSVFNTRITQLLNVR